MRSFYRKRAAQKVCRTKFGARIAFSSLADLRFLARTQQPWPRSDRLLPARGKLSMLSGFSKGSANVDEHFGVSRDVMCHRYT
ncbi:hypothetical protein BH18PSE1_BH18PSE1_12130 [soil metagenome]